MNETITIVRPANTDYCPACQHQFGEHYTTYSEVKQGCGRVIPGPRRDSRPSPCLCGGFVLMIKVDWLKTPPMLPEGRG